MNMCSNEAKVAMGLRLALGILLLLQGVSKIFGGVSNFVAGMTTMFSNAGMTWIVPVLWPLAVIIVLVEILLGAALILGVWQSTMFFITMLFFTFLNIGLVLVGNMASVAANFAFIIAAAIGCWICTFCGSSCSSSCCSDACGANCACGTPVKEEAPQATIVDMPKKRGRKSK